LKVPVVLALVFAIAVGLALITPSFSNFKVALAQEEQQQQASNSNNTLSSSLSSTGAVPETSQNFANNTETTLGEPLPSQTQSNTTMLSGEIGSIQSAHQGEFSWSTSGEWTMQLDGPLTGRPDPQIESFNATIHMVRLDGNLLHQHEISNFNQSSVTHLGDAVTTFNGTMTVTLREGPVENVSGYIQLVGDSIAVFVDPRAVDEHFGPTPIHGAVLPEEEE
jgi:hypothetical protein